MKQHITLEQLNELDDVAIRKLAEYKGIEEFDRTSMEVWRKSDGEWDTGHLLLNIGQMIEFLCNKYESKIIFSPNTKNGWIVAWDFAKPEEKDKYSQATSLCDALWEAVKSILEK